MKLSYPAPCSPSGKVYQFSPNPDAVPRLFLIGDVPSDRQVSGEYQARIRRTPGLDQTICPYTGLVADDDAFVHFADIEAITKQIGYDIEADAISLPDSKTGPSAKAARAYIGALPGARDSDAFLFSRYVESRGAIALQLLGAWSVRTRSSADFACMT